MRGSYTESCIIKPDFSKYWKRECLARISKMQKTVDEIWKAPKMPRLICQSEWAEMNLKKVLSPETVWVDLKADSKQGIIEEMIDRLVAAGKVKDRAAVLEAVLDREAKMSTGMQNGVAIPHGKTDSVKSLVAAVGLNKDGVDFDSMDGSPCTIFIMTLSPTQRTGPHIQFLAEVSRLISQPAERDKLLACRTHGEIYETLTGK